MQLNKILIFYIYPIFLSCFYLLYIVKSVFSLKLLHITVGQTERSIKTRINEHRNNKNSEFIVFKHQAEFNHEFNWEQIKIIDYGVMPNGKMPLLLALEAYIM